MERDTGRGIDWVGLPVIATVARPLCHTGRLREGPWPVTPAEGVAGVGGVRGRISVLKTTGPHQRLRPPCRLTKCCVRYIVEGCSFAPGVALLSAHHGRPCRRASHPEPHQLTTRQSRSRSAPAEETLRSVSVH
jgi:hypothetical protein